MTRFDSAVACSCSILSAPRGKRIPVKIITQFKLTYFDCASVVTSGYSALHGRKIRSPVPYGPYGRKGRGKDQQLFQPSPVRGGTMTLHPSLSPLTGLTICWPETPPSRAGLQIFRPNGLPIRPHGRPYGRPQGRGYKSFALTGYQFGQFKYPRRSY